MTPSRVTPSTLQSAFHRQMPLRRPLAQAATEPSPSSRRFRLRVGSRLPSSPPGTAFRSPLSQSPYRPSRTAALSRGQGVSPTWTEQGCLLSTSAITTVPEHDSGSDYDPARPTGGCPPARRCCGQRYALRRAAGRAVRAQGPTRTSRCRRRLPPRKAGGASPQAGFSPDTPCRAPMPTLTGEASADD